MKGPGKHTYIGYPLHHLRILLRYGWSELLTELPGEIWLVSLSEDCGWHSSWSSFSLVTRGPDSPLIVLVSSSSPCCWGVSCHLAMTTMGGSPGNQSIVHPLL